ncbi:Crp/Fnr family transcriptional regulator [Methyloferula stellata]|uniref:Crp/Fnr family transcriptional regulator n=1 Tax=Methyloferula stellata TaxID=876270 RepID=UPI00037819A5|nr:Crp/Fnr family transcriptional regulator [Methyloferula stellata]
MTTRGHADLRIRAVRSWPREHGKEAPHLTLSAADKVELGRLAQIIEYKTVGSLIFSQGDEATYLYLLAEGVVRTHHVLNNGERQVLAFLWPGDLFGLAENGRYLSCAEAITPSKVYRFPIRRLEHFLLKNPSIQDSFFVKAVYDLRNTQRQLIVMGRFDIPRRLAAFLLDCSAHEHYFDHRTKILTLPMNRDDIADYLGTSAETVTRALNRLESEGMVQRITARKIELKPAILKAFIDLN